MTLRLIHISEAMAELERELALDRDKPLVRFDRKPLPDGSYLVRFFDRTKPRFVYEFTCAGPSDAIHWVAHLAEKCWVTTRHLQLFARAAADRWTDRGGAAG